MSTRCTKCNKKTGIECKCIVPSTDMITRAKRVNAIY